MQNTKKGCCCTNKKEENGNKNTKCKCKTTKVCDCNVIHNEKVDNAKKEMLEEVTLLFMADFYKALSDSTRIKIINLLHSGEMCVCDISVVLNMTKSAISHQLQNLKEMQLIKSIKRGKEVWYSLADKHVSEVFEITKEHVLEVVDEG